MLIVFLLFPALVLPKNPIDCLDEKEKVKCKRLGYMEIIKSIENIRYSSSEIRRFCYNDLITPPGFVQEEKKYAQYAPWCNQLSRDEAMYIYVLHDILENYTKKYEKHGDAIAEECLKYSLGPFEETFSTDNFRRFCPEKIDSMKLDFNQSSEDLVRKIRKELNLIPENLKDPARRIQKIINDISISNNDNDGMKKMFINESEPLFFMGMCWCQTVEANNNYTVVENISDSSLVQKIRQINASQSYIMENDWNIAFTKLNVTVSVPWRFIKGNATIDCELRVAYRQIDFFEENPKLLNEVRLYCPYCEFEDEPVCHSLSKLPSWFHWTYVNLNKETTDQVYREYEEIEKNGTQSRYGRIDPKCGFYYSSWKIFDFPNIGYSKKGIRCRTFYYTP